MVRATLQTGRAEGDTPYALTAAGHEKLAGAVSDVFHKKVPLWHLAFLSLEMASLRGLEEDHLLILRRKESKGRGGAVARLRSR